MSVGFKNLIVWQRSMDLALDVYQLTAKFPEHERYGMKTQINRAAVSVSCNIAEGAGRTSKKEFSNFISIARGSANELETLLILAFRVDYVSETSLNMCQDKISEVQRMLTGLKKTIDEKSETK